MNTITQGDPAVDTCTRRTVVCLERVRGQLQVVLGVAVPALAERLPEGDVDRARSCDARPSASSAWHAHVSTVQVASTTAPYRACSTSPSQTRRCRRRARCRSGSRRAHPASPCHATPRSQPVSHTRSHTQPGTETHRTGLRRPRHTPHPARTLTERWRP